MTGAVDLLPPNATAFERAIDRTDAARAGLATDLVSALWDPDRCPAALLGYLAWTLSVDVWDDRWDDTTKRQACRQSFALHRLKTTAAGIRAHVALTGATVRRIVRPPATCFARAAMTDAEREDWLRRLPQVRLYPFRTTATARRRTFAGPGSWLGSSWLRAVRGDQLLGVRASFHDAGVDTPLARPVTLPDGAIRVSLPGVRRRGFVSGRGGWYGHGWLRRSDAENRIITFRVDRNLADGPIARGLTPIGVSPTRIAVPRHPVQLGGGGAILPITVRGAVPPTRAFTTRFRGFLSPSAGPDLLADRIALQDADRFPARRHARSFYGRARFSTAPFTAQLDIDLPMHRPRTRAFRWCGVGFLRAADMAPLARTIAAVSASKAARDTILIDTTNFRRPAFGDGLRFGEFTFGERMRKS